MNSNLHAPVAKRAVAGALAGIIGGMAHAAVNEIDRKALNHNADDLVMLGGVFTDDTTLARKIGIGMHLNFAAVFGAVYATVLQPKDDNDALRKGVAFAVTEHLTLFPLGLLVDKHHPHVRRGTADPFFNPRSFVEASLRHIALGVGIGISYPSILRMVRG